MTDRVRWWLAGMVCCAACLSGATGTAVAQDQLAPPASGAAASTSADYIRIIDEDGGNRVKLQTSSRTFKPRDGEGPEVHLVGVMHIGDKAYYESLQKFLDQSDVVLYEGVKPSGAGEPAAAAPDDNAKRTLTERRLRLLAILVEKHRSKTGGYPASLDAMIDALPRTYARLARGAAVDGWGHPIRLVEIGRPSDDPSKPGLISFDLVSTGTDGTAGGDGDAADIRFSDQKPLTKAEIGSSQDGIQVQMASALGLEFQLLAIDYTHPNWRNSDLSVDAVQKKLADSGQSGEALFKMLDGSSLSAKFAGLVLNLIKSSKQSQAMAKLMMMELLSNADDLISAGGAGGVGKMMQVIVIDRNQAVFDDLEAILQREKAVKSVALFYGSGHIPDMEKRLGELGYTFTGEEWFTGIEMDMKKSGLDSAQGASLRQMLRQMVEQQKKSAGKKSRDATPASEDAKD